MPVRAEQVILPTTPMASLAATYADRRILAVAKKAAFAKSLLAGYGFRDVVALQDYAAAHPVLNPSKTYDPSVPTVPWERERPIEAIFLLQVPGTADMQRAARGPGGRTLTNVGRSHNRRLGRGAPGVPRRCALDRHPDARQRGAHAGHPDLLWEPGL